MMEFRKNINSAPVYQLMAIFHQPPGEWFSGLVVVVAAVGRRVVVVKLFYNRIASSHIIRLTLEFFPSLHCSGILLNKNRSYCWRLTKLRGDYMSITAYEADQK